MNLRYFGNGGSLVLDSSACKGCGMCRDVCPHAVFSIADGTSQIVDREACMECGACARNCSAGAITVRAGVGCAAAVIGGLVRGTAPSCGPGCSTAKCG